MDSILPVSLCIRENIFLSIIFLSSGRSALLRRPGMSAVPSGLTPFSNCEPNLERLG